MRMLILADLSGSRGRPAQSLGDRELVPVDIDTFDGVLRRTAPCIRLPPEDEVSGETSIELTDLDGLHPDVLVDRLPAVAPLLRLREQLLNPSTSTSTVGQMRRLIAAPVAASAPSTSSDDAALFERLLGRRSTAGEPRAASTVSAMVRRLVEPHVAPAVDVEAPQLVAAVDEAIGTHVRRALHHPDFQAVEATWRGVHWLVSHLETSEDLRLHILDVTKEELRAGVAATSGSVDDSPLHRCLTRAHLGGAGGWLALAGDFRFGPTPDDVELLQGLGALAGSVGAPFLAEAVPAVLGCESLVATPDPRDWRPLDETAAERWSALRRSDVARWLGLALPRLMLRRPYGRRTDPVERFAFEEMPAPPRHEEYLWGSPAYACALLLATGHVDGDSTAAGSAGRALPDLASHSWTRDGATMVTPSAEVALSDRSAEAVLAGGVMPVLANPREDMVCLARWQSLSDPPAGLSGSWE